MVPSEQFTKQLEHPSNPVHVWGGSGGNNKIIFEGINPFRCEQSFRKLNIPMLLCWNNEGLLKNPKYLNQVNILHSDI